MRIISFRFDDGLWEGAQKAASILAPYRASFFIVRDWLEDFARPVLDEYNNGRYHGSIALWKEMSAGGHDVQAHSCTHRRFSTLSDAERRDELAGSIDLIRRIHDGPYIMCYPYNDMCGDDLESIGFSAGGFNNRNSSMPMVWNDTGNINAYALNSWAIREEHYYSVCEQLKTLPPDSWTILGLHSLDDEGFMPWSSNNLGYLVEFIETLDAEILSVGDAWQRLSARPGA